MKAPPFPPPPTLYSRDVSLSLSLSPLVSSPLVGGGESAETGRGGGGRRMMMARESGGGEKEGTLKTRLIQVGEGWKRRRRKRKR